MKKAEKIMEKHKKTELFLKLEETCLNFLTGNMNDGDLSIEINNIKSMIMQTEKHMFINLDKENHEKKERDEIKSILSDGILEYKKAMKEIEEYFIDKDIDKVEDGLDLAIKADNKLVYFQNTINRKKREKTESEQNLARHLIYNIYVQSHIHPPVGISLEKKTKSYSGLSGCDKIAHELKMIGLFKDLKLNVRKNIAAMIEIKTFPEGSTIFVENDYSNDIYIINSGRISIRKSIRPGGPEEELVILGKGALLGEMSAIDNSKRSATARVILDKAEVYKITGQNFMNLLKESPQISINLNRIYTLRLRKTSEKVVKYIFSGDKSTVSKEKTDIKDTKPEQDFRVLTPQVKHRFISKAAFPYKGKVY